jgi:hypothetical protein
VRSCNVESVVQFALYTASGRKTFVCERAEDPAVWEVIRISLVKGQLSGE